MLRALELCKFTARLLVSRDRADVLFPLQNAAPALLKVSTDGGSRYI